MGPLLDTGLLSDVGLPSDVGQPSDTGPLSDTGQLSDTGPPLDAVQPELAAWVSRRKRRGARWEEAVGHKDTVPAPRVRREGVQKMPG